MPWPRHYDELMKQCGVMPPVRTIYGETERLTDIFADNSFHFVYAQNSIDHTYDPIQAIRQMVRVAKENCFLVLRHVENEAENQQYGGLHQWSFGLEEGMFVIKTRTDRIVVSRELADLGDIAAYREHEWLVVQIQKRPASLWSRMLRIAIRVRGCGGKRSKRLNERA